METLKSGDVPALVTNAEVMQLLAARTEARAKHDAEVAAAADAAADSGTGNGRPGAKRKRRVDDTKRHRHRDWIESKLLDYLRSTPCGGRGGMDSSGLPELVRTLRAPPSRRGEGGADGGKAGGTKKARSKKSGGKGNGRGGGSVRKQIQNGYGLTHGETLQILNHMPSELVELHLIIEDLPNRMSDERQEELLKLIATHAGRDPAQGKKSGEDGAEAKEKDADMEEVEGDEEVLGKISDEE